MRRPILYCLLVATTACTDTTPGNRAAGGMAPEEAAARARDSWLGTYVGRGDAFVQRYSYHTETVEAEWKRDQEAAVILRRSPQGFGLSMIVAVQEDALQRALRMDSASPYWARHSAAMVEIPAEQIPVEGDVIWAQPSPQTRFTLERSDTGLGGSVEITHIHPDDAVDQRRPIRYKLVFEDLVPTSMSRREMAMTSRTRPLRNGAYIPGVDAYQTIEPLFEAVGIVARHLGTPYTSEYIQGLSGAAFRIAGICPCAPTCSSAMNPADLARLLGYQVTCVDMRQTADTWQSLQGLAEAYRANGHVVPDPDGLEDPALAAQARAVHAIIDSIKTSVRRGTPAIVWHAFTNAEYDVVTGYDDDTGEFLGWGSFGRPEDGEYGRAPQGRMVETAFFGGLPNTLLLSGPTSAFDATAAEIAALRAAVAHGRSQENVDRAEGEDWCMLQGLACYSRWADEWASPDKKREMGDAYCFGIYSSTHAAAAPFLRQIAPRHPAASQLLIEAAGHFEAEAQTLSEGRDLLWWSSPEDTDPERSAAASALLSKARDHYADGIATLERALEAM